MSSLYNLAASVSVLLHRPFGPQIPEDAHASALRHLSAAAKKEARRAGVGLVAGTAIILNFMIESGVFALPKVFYNSGAILSVVVVVIVAVILDLTKDMLLDCLGRMESLTVGKLGDVAAVHAARVADEVSEAREDGSSHAGGCTASSALASVPPESYLISSLRTFEVTDLFYELISPHAQRAYSLLLSIFIYGSLIATGTVAAASFSANIALPFLPGPTPCDVSRLGAECAAPYSFFLALFAAFAIPLSLLDIGEQATLQAVMFLARILVLLLLIATSVAGFFCDGVVFAHLPPKVGDWPPPGRIPLASSAGLGTLIPIAIFALSMQQAIPTLSQPIADKRRISCVFRAAIIVSTILYIAAGISVATLLGPYTVSQANLSWGDYMGCQATPPGCAEAATAAGGAWQPSCVDVGSRPEWATAFSYIILLVPACILVSAFPLSSVVLASNLMSAAFGASIAVPTEATESDFLASSAAPTPPLPNAGYASRLYYWAVVGPNRKQASAAAVPNSPHPAAPGVECPAPSPAPPDPAPRESSSRVCLRTRRGRRVITLLFRLLASLPPIVVSFGVRDLGQVLAFTGLIGLLFAITMPALLALYSFARQRAVLAAVSSAQWHEIGAVWAEGVSQEKRVSSTVESPPTAPTSIVALDALIHEQLPAARAARRLITARPRAEDAARLAVAAQVSKAAAHELVATPLVKGTRGVDDDAEAGWMKETRQRCATVTAARGMAAAACSLPSGELTVREVLRHTPLDAVLWKTPYTSSLTRPWVAEGVFFASIALVVWVGVEVGRSYAAA